jgi:hypothetical protein
MFSFLKSTLICDGNLRSCLVWISESRRNAKGASCAAFIEALVTIALVNILTPHQPRLDDVARPINTILDIAARSSFHRNPIDSPKILFLF